MGAGSDDKFQSEHYRKRAWSVRRGRKATVFPNRRLPARLVLWRADCSAIGRDMAVVSIRRRSCLGVCLDATLPWARLASLLAALVSFATSIVAGCGSHCGSPVDSSYVQNLGTLVPDAGLEAGAKALPPCSSCPNNELVSEGQCKGNCFPPGNDGFLCIDTACVKTVEDPNSSCMVVCNALFAGSSISGCSFGSERGTVTCNFHSEASCGSLP
jgi:hypothetical protein